MSIKLTIEDIRKRFEKLDCKLVSTKYINAKSKYKFICNKHKEYGVQETYLRNLARGQCCHYCGKEKSANSKRVPEEELKKITENAEFIYVRSEVINHERNIVYKCKKHLDKGEFHTTVSNMRTSNGNCPYCLNRRKDTNSFKEEMKNINPNIEILGEYINDHTKIKCKCLIDEYEWDGIPNNLLRGEGCKKCASRKQGIFSRHTQKWFDEKIKEIHANIVVLTPYITMKDKVTCKCLLDGYVWETTPDALINRKTGCMKCSNRRTGERCRKTNKEFLEQLKNVNPNIIPLEEYIDDHTKIQCKCEIHNYIWSVAPNKILHRYTGCPKCSASSSENKLNFILEKWGYRYEIEKKYDDCKDQKCLPFDKYLPDFNILIECDGEQHFKPVTFGVFSEEEALEKFKITQKHDKMKNEYCEKNGIPLIRIPYWENQNMESYLFDKLVEHGAIELVS